MSRSSAVILCLILAATGIALYLTLHAYSTAIRGYVAYGGEVFILALPIYALRKAYQTIKRKKG